MPYLAVKDFKFGMNRNRPRVTGIPGTLWTLANGFISRGGDVVRAKKFVSHYTLPEDTFGLIGVKGELFVFGSASAPSGIPTGVKYQQLAAPAGQAMTGIKHGTAYDGSVYAIAEYADGSLYQFFNGARVTDWDALADAIFTYNAVADLLAQKISANAAVTAEAFGDTIRVKAAVAGTAFTISTGVVDGGSTTTPTATLTQEQANVAAVTEVRATGAVEVTGGSSSPGVNTISELTVNGVSIIDSPVDWTSSNSATANLLVIAINNGTHNYSAAAVGPIVTITAAVGSGAAPNGYAVVSTTTGDASTTDTNMSGGVTAVAAVAQVEKVVISAASSDATDAWNVTVNGTTYYATGRASGTGTFAFTHRRRVWSPAQSLLEYSALNGPTDWSTSTASIGAGFINMSRDDEGAVKVVAMAEYNGNAAIFSDETILIYLLDTDDTLNAIQRTLKNTGTSSPRSVITYGNNDVYYLDPTGIRSIRTRDGYDSDFVSDIGSAIDTFVQEEVATLTAQQLERAPAAIEPDDGRYWLALDDRIIALSFYPDTKITAWSYVDPGFSVEELVRTGRRLYARSGDTIYLYGGEDGTTYPDDDEQIVTVETPFMDANDPAGIKMLNGFDMAGANVWDVDVLVDPNDTSKVVNIGNVSKISYGEDAIKLPGRTSMVAFKFTCSTAGDAKLSSMAIHYNKESAH